MYIAEYRSEKRCLAAIASDAFEAVARLLQLAYREAPNEEWQALSVRGLARYKLPRRAKEPITCRYMVQGADGKEISGCTVIASNRFGTPVGATAIAAWLAVCSHQAPLGIFYLDEITVHIDEWLVAQETKKGES